jgi:hypothetical protein
MPDRHLQGDRAATAESKNIGLIYMEILEQRSRVICGLFEAERPVCNVRGVAVSLLMGRRCIATDIATPAPLHKVRYAAMHIGHFGCWRFCSSPRPARTR